MTSFASRTITLLAIVCAAASVGCSTAEEDLCDAKIGCEGAANPDAETEVCLIQADADAKISDLRGCGALYDQAIDCFADNNVCADAQFRGGDQCKDLFDRLDDCVGSPKTLDLDD